MDNFQLVTVEQAAPKLSRSTQGLYRDIREGQFPVPGAILKFGKQIRINLSLVEETMRGGGVSQQNALAQKATA